jgi:hypothetical protein
MKAPGFINQLLDIHRNLDAFRYAASQNARLGRSG